MTKKELKDIILKTLEKEGGAAGLKALAKAAKTSKNKLKKDLGNMSGVKQHQDGDYISTPINERPKACRCKNGVCVGHHGLCPSHECDGACKGSENTVDRKKLREVKEILEVMLDEKKKKKKDRCHRKADQVYGTKTSAYKSGAIVKCRKGMIWKKKK